MYERQRLECAQLACLPGSRGVGGLLDVCRRWWEVQLASWAGPSCLWRSSDWILLEMEGHQGS